MIIIMIIIRLKKRSECKVDRSRPAAGREVCSMYSGVVG